MVTGDDRGLYLMARCSGYPQENVWFIDTVNGSTGQGVTVSVAGTDRTATIDHTFTVHGSVDLETSSPRRFTDSELDADGNGRFNERDWYRIQSLLGSTDQADLDKYNVFIEPDTDLDGDFEEHQIIAQEDLDIIRGLLDAGLGAGEFGDYDGDGVVDCADLNNAPATFSATIGGASYLVELDSDLDGDNDAADRAAFEALFPTADIAVPFGVLDLTDLVTFNTGMTNLDPVSDLAPGYGVWDLSDLNAFVSAFNSPCP